MCPPRDDGYVLLHDVVVISFVCLIKLEILQTQSHGNSIAGGGG